MWSFLVLAERLPEKGSAQIWFMNISCPLTWKHLNLQSLEGRWPLTTGGLSV